jgi:hypothetical protein
MTELVGYDATQNYWDLELGMVALAASLVKRNSVVDWKHLR